MKDASDVRTHPKQTVMRPSQNPVPTEPKHPDDAHPQEHRGTATRKNAIPTDPQEPERPPTRGTHPNRYPQNPAPPERAAPPPPQRMELPGAASAPPPGPKNFRRFSADRSFVAGRFFIFVKDKKLLCICLNDSLK